MDKQTKGIVILASIFGVAGVAYLLYKSLSGGSVLGTTAINNPNRLVIPNGTVTAAKLQAANPTASTAAIAGIVAQLLPKVLNTQKSKGGAPPAGTGTSGGAATAPVGQWSASGVRVNGDGSVDRYNSDGSYTETEKNGTVTTYDGKSGLPFEVGDNRLPDGTIQHPNGNGTYTETEPNGVTTIYNDAGNVVSQVNSDGSYKIDNGDGTFTEYGTGGDVTVYTNAGQDITGMSYDPTNGSYTSTTDTAALVSDPNSNSYDPNSPAYNPSLDYNSYSYGSFIGFAGSFVNENGSLILSPLTGKRQW